MLIIIFFLYVGGLLFYIVDKIYLLFIIIVGLFFMGLLLFIFVEYVVYCWVYYLLEGVLQGFVDFIYKMYGIYYDYFKDKQCLVMLFWLLVLVVIILLFLFKFLFGCYGFSLLVGFFMGYVFYLLVYYVVYMFLMLKNCLCVLWVNYVIYYYFEDEIFFGVLSLFWDYVFGILLKKDWKEGVIVKKSQCFVMIEMMS